MASNTAYRGYYSHRPSRRAPHSTKTWSSIFDAVSERAADALCQVRICFRCCMLTLSFLFLVALISFAVPPLKQKYWSAHEITALKNEADKMSEAVNGNLKVYDSLNHDVSRLLQETLNLINLKKSATGQGTRHKSILKNAYMEKELHSIDFDTDCKVRSERAVTEPWIPEREKISKSVKQDYEKEKEYAVVSKSGKDKFDGDIVCSDCKISPNKRGPSFSSSLESQCDYEPLPVDNRYSSRYLPYAASRKPRATSKSVNYKHTWGDNPVVKKHDCSKYDKDLCR